VIGEEWRVECTTCDWVFSPDDYEPPITTGADAVATARGHECEPQVWVTSPGDVARPWFDFRRDGSLRPNAKDVKTVAVAGGVL
jgi:hypothetical protein